VSYLIRIAIIAVSLAMVLTLGCTKNDASVEEIAANLEIQDKLTPINIFYPTADMIVEETRDIEKTKFGPEEAVRQIFEARRGGNKLDPVMPDTKVIDVKVADGMAIVNFERNVLDFEVPKVNQQLVIAAVVKTLEQFPEINQVKFQVEGLEKGKIDGRDIEKFWGDITLQSQPWNVR